MVTFEQYKAAADRIRKGRELVGDVMICAAWEARPVPAPKPVRSVWDLPIAERMFLADSKQFGW